MAVAILSILAALATPFAYWWLKRLKDADNPETIRQKQDSERAKALVSGDSNYVNGELDRLLRK